MNQFSNLELPATLSYDTWNVFIDGVKNKLDAYATELEERIFRGTTEPAGTSPNLPISIPFGHWLSDNRGSFPACLFLGETNGVFFASGTEDGRQGAIACIEELVLFCLAASRESVNVSIIDCWKLGATFPRLISARLGPKLNVVSDANAARDLLRRQVSKYRDSVSRGSFVSANELTILVIVDFPHGLDAQVMDDLILIANNAKEANCLVLTVSASRIAAGLDAKKAEAFQDLMDFRLDTPDGGGSMLDDDGCYGQTWTLRNLSKLSQILPFEIENESIEFAHGNGDEVVQKHLAVILATINNEPERKVSHLDGIRILVGQRNDGSGHHLTFGNEADVYHAMIGGQSGKGKSTLLNTIIARSLLEYDSDQLRYFIVDCSGTSFRAFDESSSVQYIVRTSNVEQSVEAAKRLEVELDRRELLLRDSACADLTTYIEKTGKPLHRLVCVIDEFHILYGGKQKFAEYFDNLLIERIARIGRKFGVHLIASTQSLGGGVRRSFLDNIPLRIALGMTEEQSQSFLSLGNRGASNLPRGQAIYNAENGARDGNVEFAVDLISPEQLTAIVAKSNERNAMLAPLDTVRI